MMVLVKGFSWLLGGISDVGKGEGREHFYEQALFCDKVLRVYITNNWFCFSFAIKPDHFTSWSRKMWFIVGKL